MVGVIYCLLLENFDSYWDTAINALIARYFFLNHMQLPPKYESYHLAEIRLNRCKEGDNNWSLTIKTLVMPKKLLDNFCFNFEMFNEISRPEV